MTYEEILEEMKLIKRLLSSQNATVVNRFFPWLERIEQNLKAKTVEDEARFKRLEQAVTELSGTVYTKIREQPNNRDVRPH